VGGFAPSAIPKPPSYVQSAPNPLARCPFARMHSPTAAGATSSTFILPYLISNRLVVRIAKRSLSSRYSFVQGPLTNVGNPTRSASPHEHRWTPFHSYKYTTYLPLERGILMLQFDSCELHASRRSHGLGSGILDVEKKYLSLRSVPCCIMGTESLLCRCASNGGHGILVLVVHGHSNIDHPGSHDTRHVIRLRAGRDTFLLFARAHHSQLGFSKQEPEQSSESDYTTLSRRTRPFLVSGSLKLPADAK
jgi:hypothetical protein